MRVDLPLILAVLGLAAAAMSFIKPIHATYTDLSAIFLYWPESYALAEKGDVNAVIRVVGYIACNGEEAPPGIAYRVLRLSCRFKP